MHGKITWAERDNPIYKDSGKVSGDRDGNKFEVQITFGGKIYTGSLLVNLPPLVKADKFTGSFECLVNGNPQSECKVVGKFLQEGKNYHFKGKWDEIIGSAVARYQFEMTLTESDS